MTEREHLLFQRNGLLDLLEHTKGDAFMEPQLRERIEDLEAELSALGENPDGENSGPLPPPFRPSHGASTKK
jgi:hypothetical protein